MRLSLALGCGLVFVTAAFGQGMGSMPMVVSQSNLKFENVPNIPKCFQAAPAHGDPGKGAFVILVKGKAGCAIPRHWHTPVEQLSFLSGTAHITMPGESPQTLTAGSFIHLPPKSQHTFICKTACRFFVAGDGPFDIHYVDDAGQEISAEQALQPMMKMRRKKNP